MKTIVQSIGRIGLLITAATMLVASSDANAATETTDTALRRSTRDLNEPTTDGIWLRPSTVFPARPVWGHKDGIRIGLPTQGPYGIIRIYHPAITGRDYRVLNFLAIEPIVKGIRCFSELEPSQLDQRDGKRLWASDEPDLTPADPFSPPRGTVIKTADSQSLQIYIMCEPFQNGANVFLRFTFYSERPDEFQVETLESEDCAEMQYCVVTATMGNYARLRRLHLLDKVTTSGELWPRFSGNGFADHRTFHLNELVRLPSRDVFIAATTDELEPWNVPVRGGWGYRGKLATQYWRIPATQVTPDLVARVNARTVYYGTDTPIPGGVSFENFEIQRSFRHGERSFFGASLKQPDELFR